MRVLYFITVLLLFGCNQKTYLPDELNVDLAFYPSFHLPIKVKIYKHKDTGYLTFIALDYDSAKKMLSFDSVTLSKEDFLEFFKKLDTVSLLQIPYDTLQRPMDGIMVEANIIQNGM